MNDYAIRPAGPEHPSLLAAVEQAAATLFPPGSIPDAIRADSVPLPVLEEAVERGDLFVATTAEGTVIGFALFEEWEGAAYLAEMDVVPEHGRKGVGRALLAAVAGRAKSLGHKALYLTTFSHVPWNAPFYAKHGFAVLKEEKTPPELALTLAAERARGLENRVAMRLLL